jgi:dienelactone hydrolase
LENIPVETVGKAIEAVARRNDVDPERIAIFGASKGGELALLVGSQYPQVHAVIADVPSPFAWQGIPTGPSSEVTSSWTVDGQPVPFVPYASAMGQVFQKAFADRTPVVMRPAYEDARKNNDAVSKAFFHIENVHGPILFLSAGDDQIWDSAAQATMAMGYLRRHNHAYADEHATYPDAGHLFLFASTYFPATQVPFGGGLTLMLGGTAQTNIKAAGEAWPRIFSFLDAALR